MNLLSVQKTAVGFPFTGSLESVSEMQAFLESQNFSINAISMHADAGSGLNYQVTFSYIKMNATNPVNFTNLIVSPSDIVVVQEGMNNLQVFKESDLETYYTKQV